MAQATDSLNSAPSKLRLRPLDSGERERHASWLELFFDLVFVLAVAQIAHVLNEHSDFAGTIKFLALFVPVWWSWVGFTFYADRFETNEAIYRILTFAAILAVAALAVNLENAFSAAGDAPFVFCYVFVRVVLIALYIRAAYHVPLARNFCLQYVYGFGFAAVLWLASLLAAPPIRYWTWAAALAAELLTPFLNINNTKTTPFDQSHIPERFGLFTIIVLGEAVIATANGAAKVVWNLPTIAAAAIGFAMAACIWWLNFDFVEDGAMRSKSLAPRFVYLYGHYFLVASVVALGIGIEHAINETNDYPYLKFSTLALLCGAIAAYLAVITIIRFAVGTCHLFYPRLASIAGALLILAFGQSLPPLFILSLLLALLVVSVILETVFDEEAEEETAEILKPCEHVDEMRVYQPQTEAGCQECLENGYKWVHLRLCLACGHVGCCDTSQHKHATKHYHSTNHPVIASLEATENWAWCYADERFVPVITPIEDENAETAAA
jgi:low temperature requirement protein LtrA